MQNEMRKWGYSPIVQVKAQSKSEGYHCHSDIQNLQNMTQGILELDMEHILDSISFPPCLFWLRFQEISNVKQKYEFMVGALGFGLNFGC